MTDEARRNDLDLIKEIREDARVRRAYYKRKMAQYHNSRVKEKSFKVGDFILHRYKPTGWPAKDGKFTPNWEGPCKVREIIQPGTYRLKNMDRFTLKRPGNTCIL